jgi:hypothetical protein
MADEQNPMRPTAAFTPKDVGASASSVENPDKGGAPYEAVEEAVTIVARAEQHTTETRDGSERDA